MPDFCSMEIKEPTIIEAEQEPPAEIAFAEADVSTRYDDVYETIVPDEVATVRWKDNAYEFVCRNGVCLRVQVAASGIVRL